jgi:hypothetical protein
MKKILLWAIVVLVIIAGVVWFFSSKASTPLVKNIQQYVQNNPDPSTDNYDSAPLTLVPQTVTLQSGTSFALQVAKGFTVNPAFEGLKRVRFMAESPDHRLFVTDMYDLSDNTKGKIYILDGWDSATKTFTKITTYLDNLRNPNNVAFYKDVNGKTWLCILL